MPAAATDTTSAQILALLPRMECGACGVAGCAPYAAALADGAIAPDACPPGGALLAQRLRRLLGVPRAPTREEFLAPLPVPQRAHIRAADCIGCTKCLDPCPTDAIVGARQQLHGVLDDDCTGCGLCQPPCPVDCIELGPDPDAPVPAPAATRDALARGPEIDACTACGKCAPACPAGLDPMHLARALRGLDLERANTLSLARCTECGACDAVCPPRIPLTPHFTHGRHLAAADAAGALRATHAAARYAAATRRRAGAPATGLVALTTPPVDRAAAAAGVAAALARSRARHGA